MLKPAQSENGGQTIKTPTDIIGWCRVFARQLRLHHWTKNILVFLPAIAGHRIGEWTIFSRSLMIFFAFGLVASAIYVINDILDYHADQAHPRKRNRPIASGLISRSFAAGLTVALFVAGMGLAISLNVNSALWVVGYVVANLAYSIYIKKTLIADIILLTSFYLVRIFAGGSATEIMISPWLAAFCFALFFSLAACKRYAELHVLEPNGIPTANRRAYLKDDAATIHMIGVAAAFSAVLILGLYVDSPGAKSLYRQPELLWLCCPLLLYWLLRLWVLAGRGTLLDDPLVVTATDWRAWVIATLCGTVYLSAE